MSSSAPPVMRPSRAAPIGFSQPFWASPDCLPLSSCPSWSAASADRSGQPWERRARRSISTRVSDGGDMAEIAPPARRRLRMDFVLALLAFASGLTDILGFLTLSNVFTSGMTGNTALLGLALGERRIFAASYAASALAGFVLGVAWAALLSRSGSRRSGITGLLGFEAFSLGAFCAIWFAFDHSSESDALYVLIALSSTGMGIQAVVARRINAPGIPTVVFTTTLTNIVIAAIDA